MPAGACRDSQRILLARTTTTLREPLPMQRFSSFNCTATLVIFSGQPNARRTITTFVASRRLTMPAAPNRPRLSLIAAVARNGAIGRDNALLWHLPEDLQHFKRTTLGCPIIMGRKTWDSIGRPLPGRHNIVISRDPDWTATGASTASSLPQALEMAGDAPKVFVIGGAQIYALALPLADELVLTEVDEDAEGDTFFPNWNRQDFTPTSHEAHRSAQGLSYAFVTYQRR
jgi:dihydrofolate reductase